MDPPARNSMWRLGFRNPVNYNDNELFCGGYSKFVESGQKCGVCGDPYDPSGTGPHEAGGIFANDIATRVYVAGQTVEIVAELTANHQGYFELKICPVNGPKEQLTQDCFDENPLLLVGSGAPRFYIPEGTPKQVTFRYEVQLPPGLTCSQCVVQWRYAAGNTWGMCDDGSESVGCGVQETFINCADVVVTSNAPLLLPFKPSIVKEIVSPEKNIAVLTNNVIRKKCKAIGDFSRRAEADVYCNQNCLRYPKTCDSDDPLIHRADIRGTCVPVSRRRRLLKTSGCMTGVGSIVCGKSRGFVLHTCAFVREKKCKAIGDFSRRAEADVYCNQNCLRYPKTCDSDDPLIHRADIRGTCVPDCPTDKCDKTNTELEVTDSMSALRRMNLLCKQQRLHASTYSKLVASMKDFLRPGAPKPPYDHVCVIGDPVLRHETQPVDIEKPEQALELIESLRKVMKKNGAIGLAAPQIGVPLAAFVMELSSDAQKRVPKDEWKVREMATIPFTAVINPQIRVLDNTVIKFPESCESMKGYSAVVPRFYKIFLKGLNQEFKPFEMEASGWTARVIQHEMDHLRGILLTDKMDPDSLQYVKWHIVNCRGGKYKQRMYGKYL
ncbi:unnamed protein product [Notodromas monacha]|uniref:Peptide deformylase n=1 Tax=Notodromas monacha TaxID=399045 RepID=A0A7R9BY57_9CRUS|nr:unnamed protein product [Notodromas monacha]CAG0923912.1 unnamed protein product [Notodromas monacha]